MANTNEPLTTKPWDVLKIVSEEGKEGLADLYRQLEPFVELVTYLGPRTLRIPHYWYEKTASVMALVALKTQWEQCCSPDGLAWVATRFWVEDIKVMQEYAKGYNTIATYDTLKSFLSSADFDTVYKTLALIARHQERANKATEHNNGYENNGSESGQTSKGSSALREEV